MKTCHIPRGGATITYDEVGDGLPVVLVHAFPLDRQMWVGQLAAVADLARVFAVDLPGFGGSKADGPFGVEAAADLVADFLDAVGVRGRAVVGGLSMGGYVALAFARRHPEKLAGLILADTKAEADTDEAKAGRDKSIAAVREKGVAALVETMLPKLLSDATREAKPDVVETVKRIAGRQSVEGVAAALAGLRDRPDATASLGNISTAAVILVGEHDAVTPPLNAAALGANIWGSKVVTIPDAGHLSNLENPEAFNVAVREFLANVHQTKVNPSRPV
jgi:pimeloyl-ACP methyl ester carboxylesterase